MATGDNQNLPLARPIEVPRGSKPQFAANQRADNKHIQPGESGLVQSEVEEQSADRRK